MKTFLGMMGLLSVFFLVRPAEAKVCMHYMTVGQVTDDGCTRNDNWSFNTGGSCGFAAGYGADGKPIAARGNNSQQCLPYKTVRTRNGERRVVDTQELDRRLGRVAARINTCYQSGSPDPECADLVRNFHATRRALNDPSGICKNRGYARLCQVMKRNVNSIQQKVASDTRVKPQFTADLRKSDFQLPKYDGNGRVDADHRASPAAFASAAPSRPIGAKGDDLKGLWSRIDKMPVDALEKERLLQLALRDKKSATELLDNYDKLQRDGKKPLEAARAALASSEPFRNTEVRRGAMHLENGRLDPKKLDELSRENSLFADKGKYKVLSQPELQDRISKLRLTGPEGDARRAQLAQFAKDNPDEASRIIDAYDRQTGSRGFAITRVLSQNETFNQYVKEKFENDPTKVQASTAAGPTDEPKKEDPKKEDPKADIAKICGDTKGLDYGKYTNCTRCLAKVRMHQSDPKGAVSNRYTALVSAVAGACKYDAKKTLELQAKLGVCKGYNYAPRIGEGDFGNRHSDAAVIRRMRGEGTARFERPKILEGIPDPATPPNDPGTFNLEPPSQAQIAQALGLSLAHQQVADRYNQLKREYDEKKRAYDIAKAQYSYWKDTKDDADRLSQQYVEHFGMTKEEMEKAFCQQQTIGHTILELNRIGQEKKGQISRAISSITGTSDDNKNETHPLTPLVQCLQQAQSANEKADTDKSFCGITDIKHGQLDSALDKSGVVFFLGKEGEEKCEIITKANRDPMDRDKHHIPSPDYDGRYLAITPKELCPTKSPTKDQVFDRASTY